MKKTFKLSRLVFVVAIVELGMFSPSMFFEVKGKEPLPSTRNGSNSQNSKEIIHKTFVKEGNVYFTIESQTRQLTQSGVDHAPLLSPDGTFIIFTRQIEVLIEDDYGEIYKGEQLWAIDVTGQNERLVLGRISDSTWDKGIVFKDLFFSPDGSKVYFSTVAGNSHALYVVNMDDSKIKFVMYGVGFDIINKVVRDDLKQYKGSIISCQKKYSIEPGSYFILYLFSPEGKQIDVVKRDCSGGYNWFEVMPHSNPRRAPVESQRAHTFSGRGHDSDVNNESTFIKISPERNQYLGMVEEIIDRQWIAPPLMGGASVVTLNFQIARSGEISHIRIAESSGNAHFDSAALRTLQAVNPLPPFSSDISNSSFEVAYRFASSDVEHSQTSSSNGKEKKETINEKRRQTKLDRMNSAYMKVQAQGAQLSSVVPNCTNSGVEVGFFARMGQFLFDEFTMLWGNFKETHRSLLEKHEGPEAANLFYEQATASFVASYQQMKKRLLSTPLNLVPTVCRNYKDQIIKGDWDFLPLANEYVVAVRAYGTKEDLKEAEFTLFEAKEVQAKLDEIKKGDAEFSSSEISERDVEILEEVVKKSKIHGGIYDPPSEEMPAKENVIQIFQMDLLGWNSTAITAAKLREAPSTDSGIDVEVEAQKESDKDVYSLIYKRHSPESYTTVLPTFSNSEEKPQALTVSLVYPINNPSSILCTNKNRAEKIKSDVAKEMAPEFSVTTTFTQTNKGCLLKNYIVVRNTP